MELGIYHEFPVLPGRSQAECFAAGFDIVYAAEEYGLDVMWLAELHFAPQRALAASPLILGTAIAARTERIKIGTSVQVVPLANPLRIAEEAAILDHVSKGRLIFGVGRSGVVKTYEAMNISYAESKDREIECLEIIQRAWQGDNFSYKGKFYDIQDVTVVPQPVQQPTPEIRLAAASVETSPPPAKRGRACSCRRGTRMCGCSSSTSTSTAKHGPTPDTTGRRPSICVAPVLSPRPMQRLRRPTGPP
jgi:alkanesulfonate monooxygenase SsuD/methylene tetrahydromethanopterin reductase-like flavin-dependent oxidoreductase (luciferase family)